MKNPLQLTVHIAKLAGYFCLFLLAGCSYIPSVPIPGLDYIAGEEGLLRDRQGDYLEAEILPRTQVPPEYDSYIIDDLMIIPEVNNNNAQAFLQAPRPRPFGGRSERGVVIQRINEESWIVVDASPSELWPRVRDYWSGQGIPLAFENPTDGLLDTSWFVLEDNYETKEKMRISIEPGFQNDSAEIRLLHLSYDQDAPVFEQVNWPAKSTDPELEFDFLSDLSSYLADVADLYQASSVSFLAENIHGRGKASIVNTPEGHALLRLVAKYDRSWAAIGRALERAGVDVTAQSVELGIYEVDYVIGGEEEEEEEGPGLFRKIITVNGLLSREEQVKSYPLKIQLIDKDGEVDVLVESLELGPLTSDDVRQAESSLLQLIRNFIA